MVHLKMMSTICLINSVLYNVLGRQLLLLNLKPKSPHSNDEEILRISSIYRKVSHRLQRLKALTFKNIIINLIHFVLNNLLI